jgi:hypothetical protein
LYQHNVFIWRSSTKRKSVFAEGKLVRKKKRGRKEPLIAAATGDNYDYTTRWLSSITDFDLWLQMLQNTIQNTPKNSSFEIFSDEIAAACGVPANRVSAPAGHLSSMVIVGTCKQLQHSLMEDNTPTTPSNLCLRHIIRTLDAAQDVDDDGVSLRCNPLPTGREMNDSPCMKAKHIDGEYYPAACAPFGAMTEKLQKIFRVGCIAYEKQVGEEKLFSYIALSKQALFAVVESEEERNLLYADSGTVRHVRTVTGRYALVSSAPHPGLISCIQNKQLFAVLVLTFMRHNYIRAKLLADSTLKVEALVTEVASVEWTSKRKHLLANLAKHAWYSWK